MNGHHPRLGTRLQSFRAAGRRTWRYARWVLAATTVPLALWACNSYPLQLPKPAPEEQTDLLYEVNPVRKLDLVFVVDNSSSMTEEQANLRANFPDFMNELLAIQGGAPDMRIAVISSNVGAGPNMPAAECPPGGDRGKFQVREECKLDAGVKYLTVDGMGKTNFETQGGLPKLPDVFSCMAALGTSGCGYEHQLLSLYFALDNTTNESNKGFIRDDAYLGVVILSDEDDCSAEPSADFFDNLVPGQAGSFRCSLKGHICDNAPIPTMPFKTPLANCKPYTRMAGETNSRLIDVPVFVDFIKNTVKKGRSEKILISSVIGWNDDPAAEYSVVERDSARGGKELDTGPVCQTANTGTAAPGIRLHTFTKAFENNTVAPICQKDLKTAMAEIGKKLRGLIENTCITAPLYDTNDKPEDGVQADCQVLDQIPEANGRYKEQAVLPCSAGRGMPCWNLVADQQCGSGFRTEVKRDMNNPAAPGTLQSIKCLTCPVGSTEPRCVRAP
jgi:hypothetical protein